jgi:hypothetical protein
MLPGQLQLGSSVNFDLREKIDAFTGNQDIILWNASLSRKILKKKAGKISLIANDLLKQNRGWNRIINSNFVSEERYSRVGQYFLLQLEWTFNQMPGGE